MDPSCQTADPNLKYLLSQLNTARKEINNLRQQINSLRYIHEKDIENIKQLLQPQKVETSMSDTKVISSEEVEPSTSKDDDILKLKPIGVISTWFPNKRGTPRQTKVCSKIPGKLILHNSVFTNPDHALEGLQEFSHMWILFFFHRNDSTHVRAKVAPPRLNGLRTGVFSTRSPHRPCPIGLSLVKIIRIENRIIYFEGVDMVDQSPVLDIKPYIPQYDNPLHIEKLSGTLTDLNTNDVEENTEQRPSSKEEISESLDTDFDSDEGSRNTELQRRNYNEALQDADISRDEEIALRLQTEEFRRPRPLQQNPEEIRTQRRSRSSSLEPQNNSIRETTTRLEGINVDGQDSTDPDYVSTNNETRSYVQAHGSRSSRPMDGADGPSTVCGADLDSIQRRALNPRIDNSPVRMGVREAPDGEEGLQPQAATSQNVSRAPAKPITNGDVSTNRVNTSVNSQTRFPQNSRNTFFSEVRIPDWISRPRTSVLSVVFNDRALIQLNDILKTKAEERKRAIEDVLREDPRSIYLRQRLGNQFYTFLIHNLHVTCKFDDSRNLVTVFQVRHAGRICECGEPEWQCMCHSL